MGAVYQLADWRVRGVARVAALALCAAFCALLVLASRTTLTPQSESHGVEVLLERPPERETTRPSRSAPGPASPDQSQAPPAAPSVEAEMLARMMRCVRRPGQPRPADCPREAAPEDWARPQIPMGGDYVPEEQPDMDRIYTRAERQTLVTPSCIRDKTSQGCVRIGIRPPPPSRSAEQICRDGGLGGPCTPPPEAVD